MKLTTLLLTSFVLITQTAFADGLLYQLPEDGAYVVHEMVLGDDGQTQFKGIRKISSVGTVTENGKKLRWIEFKIKIDIDERYDIINKILVSEEKPKAAENVFGKIIRGWERHGGGQAKAMSREKLDELSLFLCGTIKERTKLKPVMVDSKLGKLQCAGLSGYVDYDAGGQKLKIRFKTRLHKKVPFGIVSSVITVEGGFVIAPVKLSFTLKEVGKNAKSELSDAK